MAKTGLTQDDLFTLRDALIHAVNAKVAAGDTALAQKYESLFRKIGDLLQVSK